nr:NAD(P)-binding domain-containing protein [Vibrio parahaemolyticus]
MQTIGFIGLGLMGEAMSKNIVQKHEGKVFVYDLNKEQVAKLVDAGATAADSIAEVAKKADVIISMVPKSVHVQAVYKELIPELSERHITMTCRLSTQVCLSKYRSKWQKLAQSCLMHR